MASCQLAACAWSSLAVWLYLFIRYCYQLAACWCNSPAWPDAVHALMANGCLMLPEASLLAA